MPAFVFANITSVTNPDGFAKYQGEAGATVTKYGGKVLGGGNKIEIADGDWLPAGVVALEFESLSKAKEWYNSPEYQAVISGRLESSVGGVVFVDAS